MSTLVFDIGGTHLRMALGEQTTLQHIQRIDTPADPQEALEAMRAYVRTATDPIEAVSGGIAAVLADGVIQKAAHLPRWHGFALKEQLEALCDAPVLLHNDTEIAALGEARLGAGNGYDLVAYIGIGTGVGGALVEGGQIAPHAQGFEPGHQIIDVAQGTTLEEAVSGSGLAQWFGKPAEELPHAIFAALAPVLAAGLYNVLLTWSPQVLVLGGPVVNEQNGFHIDEIREALTQLPKVFSQLPPVVHGTLGDASGLYGALVARSL